MSIGRRDPLSRSPHPYDLGRALSLPGGGVLRLDRPLIMGILNVTPDSFSDGGRYLEPEVAVRRGVEMSRQGADIIDVGGESTRPGSVRVDADEQARRVVEVVRRLRLELDGARGGTVISIDTTLMSVAERAMDVGAVILNDISGGRDDPGVLSLAARAGCPLVLMHMLGTPRTMQVDPCYDDVVREVGSFLESRVDAAIQAGVDGRQIVIDPGIGFGKTTEHNLKLLNGLENLTDSPYPVLLGVSRKRVLREVCQGSLDDPSDHEGLDHATCATTALGVAAGVAIFRVHNVAMNRRVGDMTWGMIRSRPGDTRRAEDTQGNTLVDPDPDPR